VGFGRRRRVAIDCRVDHGTFGHGEASERVARARVTMGEERGQLQVEVNEEAGEKQRIWGWIFEEAEILNSFERQNQIYCDD
jgi:hypothetical protein